VSERANFSEDELLQPEKMIQLYAMGAFPMADSAKGNIEWFFPEVRTIIPLDNFHIPRSLIKILKDNSYLIQHDKDFLTVVKHCSSREETWITDKLISAYRNLEQRGHIHTVEVYEGDALVGGLYGVTFRGAFFGESMFSLKSQASKIALAHLLLHLREQQFVVLDVQYMTQHLKMFGATEISFESFSNLLQKAYLSDARF